MVRLNLRLRFKGLESGLVQNSCKRQPFSNYFIIKSEESKSYKRRKIITSDKAYFEKFVVYYIVLQN